MPYLAYDLKGIQSYIFAVPNLRSIVGGSALIDRFDRETAPALAGWLFSGGGRGLFRCDNAAAADELRQRLITAAHEIGCDIAFGLADEPLAAITGADELYAFVPEDLDGHPCRESALYPCPEGGVHRVIAQRNSKGVRLRVEEELCDALRQQGVIDNEQQCFHNIEDSRVRRALGGRQRWAVIVMDGNDMGSQFRAANDRLGARSEALVSWLQAASTGLDGASRQACLEATQAVIEAWRDSEEAAGSKVLPVRPLVVGGDDIIVLCHAAHAFTFVRTACAAFAKQALAYARAWGTKHGISLWPATGGQLTISAGVLFCPMKLPLATAIPYAEQLLASAKGLGRKERQQGQPAPACLDWEAVTEGTLETPAARRQRDLRFLDESSSPPTLIELTCRPYTLERFADLERRAEAYRAVPATLRHQVLPALRAAYPERLLWHSRLDKRATRWQRFVADLAEGDGRQPSGRWQVDRLRIDGQEVPRRRTDVLDALLLLEERERMAWITDEEDDACSA
ncbi:MAG: hypothetical protein RMM29_08225 [Planctomycetota bacterium]|nr:hypothetical protein [Planctomycetota bacterium]